MSERERSRGREVEREVEREKEIGLFVRLLVGLGRVGGREEEGQDASEEEKKN